MVKKKEVEPDSPFVSDVDEDTEPNKKKLRGHLDLDNSDSNSSSDDEQPSMLATRSIGGPPERNKREDLRVIK
jgi:hypothetical protein